MGKVKVELELPGVHASAAEELWYDTVRWPTFVDGLGHMFKVDEGWPREPGAVVIWDSNPGGRGRVLERVVSFEARVGQTVEVEDEKIHGRQTIAKPHTCPAASFQRRASRVGSKVAEPSKLTRSVIASSSRRGTPRSPFTPRSSSGASSPPKLSIPIAVAGACSAYTPSVRFPGSTSRQDRLARGCRSAQEPLSPPGCSDRRAGCSSW